MIDLIAWARDALGFDKDRGVIQVTVKGHLTSGTAARLNRNVNGS
jgi:hypothetical protein